MKFRLTVASSGVGCGATGGIFSTALCRNGIGIRRASKFRYLATAGRPVTKIRTDATMKGDQPFRTSAVEWRLAAAASAPLDRDHRSPAARPSGTPPSRAARRWRRRCPRARCPGSSTSRTACRQTTAPLTSSAGHTCQRLAPADHAAHQPERQDAARAAAGCGPAMALNSSFGQPRHAGQHANRIADAAPRHRRRVGDQAERRRLKRVEAQADQKRSGDRHRRTAATRAFEERAEAEGDEHELQPLVGRQARRSSPSSPGTDRCWTATL